MPDGSLLHAHCRRVAEIEREENKIKKSIKDAAKRNDTSTARMLAKEVVRSRKAVNRLHTSKAQMNSVCMQMENQVAQQKVTGQLTKSAEIMKMMNSLTKVGQVQETMNALQQEMTKAGLLEEMVDDAMGALDDDDAEEEADAEVDKVMAELAFDATKGMKDAGQHKVEQQQQEEAKEEEDDDMDAMRSRLAQLKS